eukprot:318766-Hanusia_phi.AAC.1
MQVRQNTQYRGDASRIPCGATALACPRSVTRRQVMGIYLDDMLSGIAITNNSFEDVQVCPGRAGGQERREGMKLCKMLSRAGQRDREERSRERREGART